MSIESCLPFRILLVIALVSLIVPSSTNLVTSFKLLFTLYSLRSNKVETLLLPNSTTLAAIWNLCDYSLNILCYIRVSYLMHLLRYIVSSLLYFVHSSKIVFILSIY